MQAWLDNNTPNPEFVAIQERNRLETASRWAEDEDLILDEMEEDYPRGEF